MPKINFVNYVLVRTLTLIFIYSSVAFYVRDDLLKASHNSRQVLKNVILAFFWGGGVFALF
jgi:hypothetical protein